MASKLIELEFVSCDLCGSENFIERYRKPDTWLWKQDYEFSVAECLKCGLVFLNPRPTDESMGQFYPSDYHKNRDDEKSNKRYENQLKYLKNIQPGKILDIGCARGDWLNFLYQKSRQWKIYGCDTFSREVSYSNIKFTASDLRTCHYESNFFDVVTAWAVFEHLHEPMLYFSEVGRILKPEGTFIFLVTNSESFYGKYSDFEDIPRHTFFFSEKSLSKYANTVGMKPKNVIYSNEIWDGRGYKNLQNIVRRKLGLSYLVIKNRGIGKVNALCISLAKRLDRLLNKINLEKNRPTGIMICEWTK